ncbi:hypothetical protein JKP88DRAFT_223145 [Tribonema minus]|uniref:EF-hand domain-containing protein n=1 Tax=Tribonema minus TaxID=303371 RepID=A0A836CCD1_9STRA|nr:hypothetical protein JKP88DRAFT_223145 [Tribonema minus]
MVELGGGGASERADAEEDEAGGGVSAAARATGASAQPAPRFYFQISESSAATPLSIEENDARAVMELVDRTGLARAEPQRICGALLRAADAEGALSKRAFDQCMQVLALGAQLKAQERTRCAVLLSSIYYAFDRGNDGRVDALELATGFSILCGGNKSSKLVYAWDLLADADGALTRRGLWRYMRSFLTVLMALSSASGTLTAKELTRAVDDSAVWVSARVFADLRAADAATRITFTDLADWYTEGLERSAAPGFMTSPWLELLDMSKWGAALGGA